MAYGAAENRDEGRMHVAYLHYLSGDDTALCHVRQFARAARDLGHRIDEYAMNLGSVDASVSRHRADPLVRARSGLKRHLSRYLHETKELAWNVRYVGRELKLLRAARPEVLLVRDAVLTSSCVPVSRRLKLPLVLEVNAPAIESRLFFDQYLHVPLVPEWLERWKLRCADAIIVVSTALRDYLSERHDLPTDRFIVVPNGVDLGSFHPALTPAPDVPADFRRGPVVGFVGSFQAWHGTKLLACLAKAVGSTRSQVSFLFVGDGPELASLKNAISGLASKVLFPGRVPHDRVPGLVACFDIGVVADAAFYMSPLKVMEWMAAGRAVVAPRYRPLEELIEHDVHGLLFTPQDADGMIQAVLRLVDDRKLRDRLGRAAAERARSSLGWQRNAEQVVAACRLAAQRQHRWGEQAA